jgi:antitoxin PrlF
MPYDSSSTMTSKGQVTVPADIRERLGIKAGDRLDFHLADSGTLTIVPVKRRSIFEDFHEVQLPSRGRAVSRNDVDNAIAATVAEKFPRPGKRKK